MIDFFLVQIEICRYNIVCMNLLDDLNQEQIASVTHKTGPLMIVAGAGTGKTTVVTRRIAWLIEQGIGLSREFKLLSELDTWLLIRQKFDRFSLDYYRPLGNPTKFLRGFMSHFSRLKDSAIDPDAYLSFVEEQNINKDAKLAGEDTESEFKRQSELANAYQTYQMILSEHDSLDFGDLILYALKLLRERPCVLKLVRERFRYILVDEFQDTNHAQYELVKLIAMPENNLTVVGDDDQSIYKFRGASLENILRFEEDYPNATRIVLTKNYRSGQAILDRAHAFIQMNNPYRLEAKTQGLTKRLISQIDVKGVVEHIHSSTLEDEVLAVVNKIAFLKEADPELSWNDFAVLVRSNSAGDDFSKAFERHNIPYQFLALTGLYTKPVVLDILALMHVIDHPFDSPSFYRVLNLPMHKFDPRTISEINLLAQRKGKSLFEACEMANLISKLETEVQVKLRELLFDLSSLRTSLKGKPATECLKQIVRRIGYIEYLNKKPESEKLQSFRYLDQFLNRVKSFESRSDDKTLHAFLAEFAHERDAGEEGSLSVDLDSGPELVRIMTVHSSKGLEFRHVFIVNLVDRRFPSQSRGDSIPLPEEMFGSERNASDEHLEEERRLFYVAMTRAKEGLYFTSADDYGSARSRKLSRFLNELGYEKPDDNEKTIIHLFDTDIGEDFEHKIDSRVSIPVPKRFSFTQLAAFKTCPYQYKFAHVLKVPVFGRWTFSFGKTMHNTLQSYFTTWIERAGKRQSSLFGSSTLPESDIPVSETEILEMYAKSWIDDWYEDDKQREEYKHKGKESLLDYVRSFNKTKPHPLFLEQGFTLKFGDVILKGRIDRIDAFEDGVEIIDYKTGSPKNDKTLKKEDREQLYLYQLAAIDVLGLKPKKLTYHYMEDNSEVSFLGSDKDLSEFRENVIERVQSIRNSMFDPTPGFHCRYCDFADICEFRGS